MNSVWSSVFCTWLSPFQGVEGVRRIFRRVGETNKSWCMRRKAKWKLWEGSIECGTCMILNFEPFLFIPSKILLHPRMFFLFEINENVRYNEAEHDELKLRKIFRREQAAVARAKCSRTILRRSTNKPTWSSSRVGMRSRKWLCYLFVATFFFTSAARLRLIFISMFENATRRRK